MNVLITGAANGIGYQAALEFCKKRVERIFIISRNETKLDELRQNCKKISPSADIITIPFDLENLIHEDLRLIKIIKEHTDSIDILVNNAGMLESKNFTQFNTDNAIKIFNINFFAPAELIRQLFPFLKKAERAHVVNIGSMGGVQGSVKFPGLAYYSSSKSAIATLTECLAEEFKDTGISFNCLALGAVQTEMLEKAFPGYKAPVDARQMAEFIVDFALNGYKHFNGKIIPVSLSTP